MEHYSNICVSNLFNQNENDKVVTCFMFSPVLRDCQSGFEEREGKELVIGF